MSEVYRCVTLPHSIKTRSKACNSRVPTKERATPARRCVCRFSLAKQISQCVVRLCRIPQQSRHEKDVGCGLGRHTYTLRRLTSLSCLDPPVPDKTWLQWLWSHSTHLPCLLCRCNTVRTKTSASADSGCDMFMLEHTLVLIQGLWRKGSQLELGITLDTHVTQPQGPPWGSRDCKFQPATQCCVSQASAD